MRQQKILVLILLFIGFYLPCKAVKTILCGHFSSPHKELVSVQYYANPVDDIEQTHTQVESVVDSGNNFKVVLDIDAPVSINVRNVDSWVFINKFINPGDSLWLGIGSDQMDIEGIGDKGLSGMFEYDAAFSTADKVQERQNSFKTKTDTAFAKYWSDWVDSGIAFYEKFYQANPAPRQYIDAVENSLRYDAAVNIVQFGWRGNSADENLFRKQDYKKYLDKLQPNNESGFTCEHYTFLLKELPKNFIDPLFYRSHNKDKPYDYYDRCRQRDSVARIYFTGKSYDIALYSILYDEIISLKHAKGTDHFDSAFLKTEHSIAMLDNGFNDKTYIGRIQQKLRETKEANMPAYDFSASTLEGKEVKLSDFKGKVVYVDFWATNCAPCVSELPYIKKLQEKYKDKDIVFLYVSFDNNKETLKRFIKEKDFTGLHLIDTKGFSSDAAMHYHISGIPRYILVDRKGNLVSSDAHRPSTHPEEMIDNALK